jgi:DNA-binding CsgD family transcriptional regulator
VGIRIRPGDAEDGGYMVNGFHLTKREIEALSLLAMGLENEKIAKKLGIGVNTVRNHIYNISQKLGAKHRAHAVVLGIQKGILHITEADSIEWAKPEFLYCLGCGRTFRNDEWIETPPSIIEINHVKYEVPPDRICFYPGCNSWSSLWVDWNEVRQQHPEYPEVPKRDVKFDFSWELGGAWPRIYRQEGREEKHLIGIGRW